MDEGPTTFDPALPVRVPKVRSIITVKTNPKKTKNKGFLESQTEAQHQCHLASDGFASCDDNPGPRQVILASRFLSQFLIISS